MQISHFQNLVLKVLQHWGLNPQVNVRPEWLKGLEIDLFIPQKPKENSIIIEVDGPQHDRFTPTLHKTYDNYLKQVGRDGAKEILVAQNEYRFFIRVKPRIGIVDFLQEELIKAYCFGRKRKRRRNQIPLSLRKELDAHCIKLIQLAKGANPFYPAEIDSGRVS